jgi:hypothetical protein
MDRHTIPIESVPSTRGESTPARARRRRGRRPRAETLYAILASRRQTDLAHLADHSLSRELSILRIRLAELVATPDVDWRETLKTIEACPALVRRSSPASSAFTKASPSPRGPNPAPRLSEFATPAVVTTGLGLNKVRASIPRLSTL